MMQNLSCEPRFAEVHSRSLQSSLSCSDKGVKFQTKTTSEFPDKIKNQEHIIYSFKAKRKTNLFFEFSKNFPN